MYTSYEAIESQLIRGLLCLQDVKHYQVQDVTCICMASLIIMKETNQHNHLHIFQQYLHQLILVYKV